MKKEIILYSPTYGGEPLISWLKKLDSASRARINHRIALLELEHYGDCKFLREGVYELRIHFGPGYRVYFGKNGNKVVL